MKLRNFTIGLGLLAAFYSADKGKNLIDGIKQSNFYSAPFSPLSFPYKKETVVLPIPEVMSLYTSCDQKTYNGKAFVPAKSTDEILNGVKRRRALENIWRMHFNEKAAKLNLESYTDITTSWTSPVNVSWVTNNYNGLRARARGRVELHRATDIFTKTGSKIYAPVNGVIVASSGNWTGSWTRRKGLHDVSGGLGAITGNGAILFGINNTIYFLMAHLKDVYVRAGDVVLKGDVIGTVWKTGNAMSPRVPGHLHLAYKKPGTECGIEGVLVSENPYPKLKETIASQLAQKN